jgi:uncharacterized membrane protein YdfJ with MMPL/SSD domain
MRPTRRRQAVPRILCSCDGFVHRRIGDTVMLLRKLAILPAVLFAFGLTVAMPTESFAQSNKPAATKKAAPAEKKAKKKSPAKKKAADAAKARAIG